MGVLSTVLWALSRTQRPRYPQAARLAPQRIAAGVYVTAENSLQLSAVWACCRYLSQMVALLPWRVMQDGDDGAAINKTHPVNYLLSGRASPETSAFQFRETMMQWALRHGNGYAEIERNLIGLPVALWLIHPDRGGPERATDGRLQYRFSNESGPDTILDPMDVFHVRGFGDGLVGLNVMQYAAQSIGWAKATQLFGASFFGAGANPTGVVEIKKPMTPAGLALLKETFANLYKGVTGERTAFVDNETTYKSITIEPEKGQFVETNQFQISEVCRWFGVPPHKIAHLINATFSNIEHQSIEVVQDSLTPWVKRFEEEADFKLFGPANRQGFFTRIYLQALLRGDTAARASYYKTMREIGVFSVNDILRLEDMNTISDADGGDKHVMQSQFTTLEKIGEAQPGTAPSVASDASPASGADAGNADNSNSNDNGNGNDNVRPLKRGAK